MIDLHARQLLDRLAKQAERLEVELAALRAAVTAFEDRTEERLETRLGRLEERIEQVRR